MMNVAPRLFYLICCSVLLQGLMDLLYEAAHTDGNVDPNEFTHILRPVSETFDPVCVFLCNQIVAVWDKVLKNQRNQT